MRVLFLVLALAFGASILPPTRPARAADEMHIVAVVNDEIISAFDVLQRTRLALSATGTPDTPENEARLHDQVLRQLIDEHLEMQEAKRLKITVSDKDIQRAFRLLEQQNHLPQGSLPAYLKQRGIDENTLIAQLRAEIAWTRVIHKQFASNVEVSDADVKAALARIAAHRNENEAQLSLILLVFDSPDQAAKVGKEAAGLVAQLRSGGNFAGTARQFSQGPGAQNGGDVGWVEPGTLPEAVDKVVASLPLNTVSDPIRTLAGYYIVEVHDRRRIGSAPPPAPTLAAPAAAPASVRIEAAPDASVHLVQIFLPFTKKPTEALAKNLMSEAEKVSAGIKSCRDMEHVAQTMAAAGSGDLGTIPLSSLPQVFREPAATLPIGRPSQPLLASNGVHVLMVCARSGVKVVSTAAAPAPAPAPAAKAVPAALPSMDEMREKLLEQKVELKARGLLRDLRRDAVVELRK